jgi:hypothetical protein
MLEGMEKWPKEEEEEEKLADFESFLLSANEKIDQLPGLVISDTCFNYFCLCYLVCCREPLSSSLEINFTTSTNVSYVSFVSSSERREGGLVAFHVGITNVKKTTVT